MDAIAFNPLLFDVQQEPYSYYARLRDRAPVYYSFIGSANRDERAFDTPDTFDIDRRAASRHLSFAQGPHYCIGAGLGRTMCTMAVRTALERMPKLTPCQQNIQWLPSFWVRGLQRYLVSP